MKRFLLIYLMLFAHTASTAIINVPADHPTIQQGIDAGFDGDTVLVQPGTYVENINFNGHNIVLGSLFLMSGDTSYISTTIIDGDSAGSVITFDNGEDSTATIKGFTLTNGAAENGGGVKCLNGSGPNIKNNLIYNNLANFRGGGVYCDEGSNSLIAYNSVDSNFVFTNVPANNGGGGISCFNSSPIIVGNNIRFNDAPSGGGVWCYEASPLIAENEIIQNIASASILGGDGGGIACWNYSRVVINDNIINYNISLYGYGGGISCTDYSVVVIENNDIAFNTADFWSGGGIAILFHADCSVSGNTIVNNLGGYGGGIVVEFNAYAVITRNVISYNISPNDGGGLYSYHSDPIISYNQFISNNANAYGGGICGYFADHNPLFHNNTISDNTASSGGSAVALYGWTGWSFYNNICRGVGSSIVMLDPYIQVTYCDIQGGYPGEGNIDCDPGFCDPGNDNYYLDVFSCCVGAGRDSLGNPDPNVNIGALGIRCNLSGVCDYVVGDVNYSGAFNGLDVIYSVSYFKGGPSPVFVCECTPGNTWYVGGDVNASCSFNGLDVTTMVNFLKGGPPLLNCPDCPPVE